MLQDPKSGREAVQHLLARFSLRHRSALHMWRSQDAAGSRSACILPLCLRLRASAPMNCCRQPITPCWRPTYASTVADTIVIMQCSIWRSGLTLHGVNAEHVMFRWT